MGPGRGPRPTSFRAEGYGMLSFLLFLRRVSEFTSMHDPWIGTIATDSESLLKTLKSPAGKYPSPRLETPHRIAGDSTTLDPLQPDWDILIEIQHALSHLPEITLQFVKGHQDRKIRFERLPLMAQLNVEADDMASVYQNTFGGDRPFVMLSPRTRAHLVTIQGTITSRYPAAIRKAYSGPALQLYIQKRHGWSDSTFQSINWTAHGQVLRNHITLRIHYSKLVHDILPTFAYLNKMDKGKRCCPRCAHPHEDRDHIIQCPHRTRNKWRHGLLTNILEICINQHTYEPLLHLLQDALRGWMYHNNPDQEFILSYQPYPHELHLLIRQQNKIGWRQLFQGRFSQEWSRIQSDYYYRTLENRSSKNHKMTGNGWQVKIITTLWTHWRTLWKQRNQDVFGHDAATIALAETKEVTRRLGQLYDQRLQMEPSAQSLLCKEIQDHLQHPTWVIRNWLTTHAPVFQTSILRARKQATSGARSIRTYFGTG
jgi:hypothetical protein